MFFEIFILKLSVLAHRRILEKSLKSSKFHIQLNSVMGLTSFGRVNIFCRGVRSSSQCLFLRHCSITSDRSVILLL